jgi:hypothetical protein
VFCSEIQSLRHGLISDADRMFRKETAKLVMQTGGAVFESQRVY